MKKKISKILKNKSGFTTVQVVVIFLVIMIIFSVVMEYASIFSLSQEVEASSQLVLDSLLMENAMELFDLVKNGHTSMTEMEENKFSSLVDRNQQNFTDKLLKQLGIDGNTRNGGHYRGFENSKVFVIADGDIKAEITNKDSLVVSTEVIVGKDIFFVGKRVAEVRLPLRIKSRYTKMSFISAGQVERGNEPTTLGSLFNVPADVQVTEKKIEGTTTPQTTAAPHVVDDIQVD